MSSLWSSSWSIQLSEVVVGLTDYGIWKSLSFLLKGWCFLAWKCDLNLPSELCSARVCRQGIAQVDVAADK